MFCTQEWTQMFSKKKEGGGADLYVTYISITLQVFSVLDVSPGANSYQPEGVGDAIIIPQEGLPLADRIPHGLHHSHIGTGRDQPGVCRLGCLSIIIKKSTESDWEGKIFIINKK